MAVEDFVLMVYPRPVMSGYATNAILSQCAELTTKMVSHLKQLVHQDIKVHGVRVEVLVSALTEALTALQLERVTNVILFPMVCVQFIQTLKILVDQVEWRAALE